MITLLIIAGTRPEVIKIAPLVLKAKEEEFAGKIHVGLCLTGQHQSMADEALSIFGISGDYNLRIMTENQTLNDVSKSIFEKLPPILQNVRPDVVLVQGDTTSAAVAAVCSFNLRIPVAHIESGLRSFDMTAPFPEELNRKIISCAAQYNFCPTRPAMQNLAREGVPEKTIFLTGNTIVDALRIISERQDLNDLGAVSKSIRKPFVLVTAHRRESFGKGIENICDALKQCANLFPGHQFVYPVHMNPNINKPVRERLGNIPNVLLMPPVSYLILLSLLKNCEFVISDSGGIQEEAPSFGKYCIVMRDVTERAESVELHLSELVGTDFARIVKAVSGQLADKPPFPRVPNPYGDGHAANRILQMIFDHEVDG